MYFVGSMGEITFISTGLPQRTYVQINISQQEFATMAYDFMTAVRQRELRGLDY